MKKTYCIECKQESNKEVCKDCEHGNYYYESRIEACGNLADAEEAGYYDN